MSWIWATRVTAGAREETSLLGRVRSAPEAALGRAPLASLVLATFTAACGFPKTVDRPPPPIGAAQAERAAQGHPGVTRATLDSGRDLFAAKCNGCHGYPDTTTIADEKWPETISRMGKKANLSEDQSNQVLAFIRAAKTE